MIRVLKIRALVDVVKVPVMAKRLFILAFRHRDLNKIPLFHLLLVVGAEVAEVGEVLARFLHRLALARRLVARLLAQDQLLAVQPVVQPRASWGAALVGAICCSPFLVASVLVLAVKRARASLLRTRQRRTSMVPASINYQIS
jgi:hypothetical protein